MICKYCQAELEEGSVICPACGKALEDASQQPAAEGAAEVVTAEQEASELPAAEEAAAGETADETEETVEETEEEKAAREAAAQKAEKRENLFVRITAIVTCVVLVLALVGAAFAAFGGDLMRKNDLYSNACYAVEDSKAESGANKVVATVDGAKLTNAQLQMLYWDQVYNFANTYYSYLAYLGLDFSQPLHTQDTGDGTTWEQYFLEGSLETWHQYQALALEAQKANFVLPEAMQEFLNNLPETLSAAATSNNFATVDDMAVGDYGPGSNGKIYQEYMELYYTAIAYFDHLYGQLEATEDEISAYYAANSAAIQSNYGVTKETGKLVDVRHILILPEGGITDEAGQTTYSETEWEACRVKAQAVLDEYLAGNTTESDFAQLAVEYNADPGSQSSGGLYEKVYEGQMVPAFNDWCFDEARKEGDTGLVKTNYGYHVMYYVCGDEGWIRYCTEGVVSEKGAELLEEIMAKHPIVIDYRKIGLGQVELAK